MNIKTSIAIFGISFLAAGSAWASEAYVTSNVYLRAGPDSSYPRVARLRAGSQVAIEGCVDGWSWCDVTDGDQRGWVAGYFLREEYEGRRVYLRDYGVQIGVPIVSFEFGRYWGDHYRNRSWYGKREHWSHVRPQYRVDERSHGERRADAHNYSQGDTRTNVRSGAESGRAPVRVDEPVHRNRATNAATQAPAPRIDQRGPRSNGRSGDEPRHAPVRANETVQVAAPPQPVRTDQHPRQRSDDHTYSGRIDSGQARPTTVGPAPTPVAPQRAIAERNAATPHAPKNAAPAKPSHERNKDNGKDDNDAHRHDPNS